jgi:hypothetical protein
MLFPLDPLVVLAKEYQTTKNLRELGHAFHTHFTAQHQSAPINLCPHFLMIPRAQPNSTGDLVSRCFTAESQHNGTMTHYLWSATATDSWVHLHSTHITFLMINLEMANVY